MKTTKYVDVSQEQFDNAKNSAFSLVTDMASAKDTDDLFYTDNLIEIENGIKRLNETANKSWLLSSILLFSLIYNQSLYQQSGLSWEEYVKQSRERLGIEQRIISEQLSSARFFIQYHEALRRAGWTPNSSVTILARAEYALELSGDLDATIKHIANDTFEEFKNWYSTFKSANLFPPKQIETKRDDIQIKGDSFFIKGIDAIKISDDIPASDKKQLQEYLTKIFEIIKEGNIPAIVSVYDTREASILPRLRDNFRQGK